MHREINFETHPLWGKANRGSNVRIGYLCRVYGVMEGVTVGPDSVIEDLTFILAMSSLTIGTNVTLMTGSILLAHRPIHIHSNATLMPGACLMTRYPHAGGRNYTEGPIVIGSGALIGPNAVVMPNSIVPACQELSPNEVWQ